MSCCRYGRLYFYLYDLIKAFCDRIKQSPVSFCLFHVDAVALPGVLGTKLGCKTIQFDRIDVSNITDVGYLGPEVPVTILGPLLKSHAANPWATLISLHLNAVPEMQHLLSDSAQADMMKTTMQKTAEYLPLRLQNKNYSATLYKFLAAKDMFLDFDRLFNQFMRDWDFVAIGRQAGLCMKKKHSIIEAWPMRLKKKPGQPDAKEEFMRLLASGNTGWERYVEWKRI